MWLYFIGVVLVILGILIREQSLYLNVSKYEFSEMSTECKIEYILSAVLIIGGLLIL